MIILDYPRKKQEIEYDIRILGRKTGDCLMETSNSGKRLDKKITYAYIILLILAVLLTALEYAFANDGVAYDVRTVVDREELCPERVEIIDQDTRDFYFTDVRVFGEDGRHAGCCP